MGFNFGDTTTFDRELMLTWFLTRMEWEQRKELIREFPSAYNRLCAPALEAPIVSVVFNRLKGTDKEVV
jgi:hypothetical protein